MADVVIYGIGDMAEIACYYLQNDSEHKVVAFCVDDSSLRQVKYFKNFPVIKFNQIENEYPSSMYKFFAPMSSEKMNTLREEVYYSIKKEYMD